MVAPPAPEAADPEPKPLADNFVSSEGSGVRGNASPEKQTEEEVATNIDNEDSGVHKNVDNEGSSVQETGEDKQDKKHEEEMETEQKEKHEDKQDQNSSEQEKKTIVEEDD